MHVALDTSISREFWRQIYPVDRTPVFESRTNPPVCEAGLDCESIELLLPPWADPTKLELPSQYVDLLSSQRSQRRATTRYRVRASVQPLPVGSYYRYSESVYIASPEFVFLQAARRLPLAQLIAFGDELCGLYSFDKHAPRGFRERTSPIATAASIEAYLENATHSYGLKEARLAARHLVDRCASPRETMLEMLLCLPYRLGGYCLQKPQMNPRIDLDVDEQAIASRNYCKADLYWKRARLDVEYLGEYDHALPTALHDDRRRTNALQVAGINVMELTSSEVSDIEVFDTIALHIAGILGKRIRSEYRGGVPQRRELRRLLFEWNNGAWMW